MPSLRVDCMNDINGLANFLEARLEKDLHDDAGLYSCMCEDSLTIVFNRNIRRGCIKYPVLLRHISDILADYIMKAYEESILLRVISRVCKGLPQKECDEIYRIAYARLYSETDSDLGDIIEARRMIISKKIEDYLIASDRITIEGFVTFRLQDYIIHLEDEVERSIRQFLIEKQYEEYINLLTTYLRMQVPRVPELHVIVQKNGTSYKVEGKKPFNIPKEIIESFGISSADNIIDNDDFMIGFLLLCAPIRVVIHNVSLFLNKELLNTIRIIFSECILISE